MSNQEDDLFKGLWALCRQTGPPLFLENKLDHNHKEVIYGVDVATPKSLLSACKHFFGLLPHQKSAIEFGQEYKKLTSQDKLELKAGLEAVGYHITESAGIPAHA